MVSNPLAISFLCATISATLSTKSDTLSIFLISLATTANPLPCSPALAASIDAFKDNKLTCSAICEMDSAITHYIDK